MENWKQESLAALSLVNYAAQHLDESALTTLVEGWLMWSKNNYAGSGNVDAEIAGLLNSYTATCVQEGGRRLADQRRIVSAVRRDL